MCLFGLESGLFGQKAAGLWKERHQSRFAPNANSQCLFDFFFVFFFAPAEFCMSVVAASVRRALCVESQRNIEQPQLFGLFKV